MRKSARSRLHGGQAAYRLLGIGLAGGVGVLGNAPHTLDAVVRGDHGLDDIHIGTLPRHGNGDVLDTEVRRDAEMAVVTGKRAEELHGLAAVVGGIRAPGLAARGAATPELAAHVVLDQKAGGTQHERLLGGNAQHLACKRARRGNAFEATIVGAIDRTSRRSEAESIRSSMGREYRPAAERACRAPYRARARALSRHLPGIEARRLQHRARLRPSADTSSAWELSFGDTYPLMLK